MPIGELKLFIIFPRRPKYRFQQSYNAFVYIFNIYIYIYKYIVRFEIFWVRDSDKKYERNQINQRNVRVGHPRNKKKEKKEIVSS